MFEWIIFNIPKDSGLYLSWYKVNVTMKTCITVQKDQSQYSRNSDLLNVA